jgi:hypothetical protein
VGSYDRELSVQSTTASDVRRVPVRTRSEQLYSRAMHDRPGVLPGHGGRTRQGRTRRAAPLSVTAALGWAFFPAPLASSSRREGRGDSAPLDRRVPAKVTATLTGRTRHACSVRSGRRGLPHPQHRFGRGGPAAPPWRTCRAELSIARDARGSSAYFEARDPQSLRPESPPSGARLPPTIAARAAIADRPAAAGDVRRLHNAAISAVACHLHPRLRR